MASTTHISNYIKKILTQNPLTSATRLAKGTTAERPASPVNGDIRYNTTTDQVEAYKAGSWQNL